MYHLGWIDHDGSYIEEYKNRLELAKKLIEIARKEEDSCYGTHVILATHGRAINYRYIVDEKNSMEKIMLDGDIIISNKLPDLKDRVNVYCPVCGEDAGYEDDIEAKIDDKDMSLTHFICSECGKEFYL